MSWVTDSFRIKALKAGYIVDPEADDMVSDLDATQVVATSNPILGKAISRGWFYALPTAFPTLVNPAQNIGSLVVYRDTGVDATSDLVLYIDSARSLPFRFTGGTVYVVWQVGERGVFRL
jgi:hypothetical protein